MSGLLKQLEKKLSIVLILMSLAVVLMLSGCSGTEEESRPASSGEEEAYTLETKVEDVINDPVFGDYGVFCQVLFPEKSVGIPFFQQGIFPAFSGHYASLRMRACSIR